MSINNSQQISDIKTMLVKGMNGEGIESIEKTATEGFIDTYTITYTDGTKTTFDVTNGNWGIWTSAVTAAQGATSVAINNDAIGTTSILEVYSQNVSGTVITVNDIDVTPGTAVLSFPALAEATDFILHIVNGTASGGGGGGGGTTDYLDLTNKPQINGVTLTGNKATSDFGLINTFQGTIAEWNQLTTAEKKAYDHASIPDSLDGNVTFPASKVMMNDGASVEADLASAVPRTASGTTTAQLVTAIGQLSETQKSTCVIDIVYAGVHILLRRAQEDSYLCTLVRPSSSSNGTISQYYLNTTASKFSYVLTTGTTSTDQVALSMTSWTLYYQGTPIS